MPIERHLWTGLVRLSLPTVPHPVPSTTPYYSWQPVIRFADAVAGIEQDWLDTTVLPLHPRKEPLAAMQSATRNVV